MAAAVRASDSVVGFAVATTAVAATVHVNAALALALAAVPSALLEVEPPVVVHSAPHMTLKLAAVLVSVRRLPPPLVLVKYPLHHRYLCEVYIEPYILELY